MFYDIWSHFGAKCSKNFLMSIGKGSPNKCATQNSC